MYPQNPYKRSQTNSDKANLLVNIVILGLTIGIYRLNQYNVYLNQRNVELNSMNVISNRKSAESGKQTLEILKEINAKL